MADAGGKTKKSWFGRKKRPGSGPGESARGQDSGRLAAGGESDDFNVDDVMQRLKSASSSDNTMTTADGTSPSQLAEVEIFHLVARCRKIFLMQPPLIRMPAGVNICGDVHGQFTDLLRLLELGGEPSEENPYLFLGDYVDRGKKSIETICLLLCFKYKFPNHFYLLRGNHESANINRLYGFFDECKRRYTVKLWRVFCDCFNCLPIVAVVENSIMCMHGGLSPEFVSLDQLDSIKRPAEVGDTGLICDLLWADPKKDIDGYQPSDRGVSFGFGEDKLTEFLKTHELDLICRAHQVVEDGYEFFGGRKLVTIFSAPNYCGTFDNNGGMMCVSPELRCSFKILPAAKLDKNT